MSARVLSMCLCVIGLALFVATSALAQGAATGWHPPSSEAEKALDATLRRVDGDTTALDNLLGGRGNRNFRRTVDYRTMMTAGLLASIASVEKARVKADCGGRYRSGELCGLDYIPVTCAQDSSDAYVYRTAAQEGVTARIEYAWATEAKAPIATYRLIKQSGAWKVDGIKCTDGDAFNLN